MSLRRRAPKRPANFTPMIEAGYGLWEVWYDYGPKTHAFAHQGERIGTPMIFLYDRDAAQVAMEEARKHPDRRYAVKEHR